MYTNDCLCELYNFQIQSCVLFYLLLRYAHLIIFNVQNDRVKWNRVIDAYI